MIWVKDQHAQHWPWTLSKWRYGGPVPLASNGCGSLANLTLNTGLRRLRQRPTKAMTMWPWPSKAATRPTNWEVWGPPQETFSFVSPVTTSGVGCAKHTTLIRTCHIKWLAMWWKPRPLIWVDVRNLDLQLGTFSFPSWAQCLRDVS